MAKQKNSANPILSHQIRVARKTRNLTQEKLAEKIGVTAQTIRKYESGKYGVPKTSVNLLVDALGCCSEFLYGKTNCFTKEEYQSMQADIKESVQKFTVWQNQIKQQWRVTADFFEMFLGHTIKDTYKQDEDGSFEPLIRIVDPNNCKYDFHSKIEAENFLLDFYDDVKKVLRYHLLEYADQQKTTSDNQLK